MKVMLPQNRRNACCGAQVLGEDVLPSANRFLLAWRSMMGCTITTLGEDRLSIAPPFSERKDPVNLPGMVAADILAAARRYAFEPLELCGQQFLLDVRNPTGARRGSPVLGAVISMPQAAAPARWASCGAIERSSSVCRSGQRRLTPATRAPAAERVQSVENIPAHAFTRRCCWKRVRI